MVVLSVKVSVSETMDTSRRQLRMHAMVEPDTVVCIIEAMKVMNEIKAEVKGTIVEVQAEDGKPVEYGQALFRVKAD